MLQKPYEQGKSITGQYYGHRVLSDINRFYRATRQATVMRGIKILHDNAPAHRSHVVQEYLQEENIQTLPHPPYSPDLAPCDFFLFPQKCLARRRFHCRAALRTAVFQCLMHLSKTDFQRAFQSWVERLRKCLAVQGEYFEQLK